MKCTMCKGKCEINRPYSVVCRRVEVLCLVDDKLEPVTREMKSRIGGVDACPFCTGRAEQEYLILKDMKNG